MKPTTSPKTPAPPLPDASKLAPGRTIKDVADEIQVINGKLHSVVNGIASRKQELNDLEAEKERLVKERQPLDAELNRFLNTPKL